MLILLQAGRSSLHFSGINHYIAPTYWAIQAGVVNSLDFCPASLKSLGCFYFRCVLSSQWKAVTVNLRILQLPTLKVFLEARSHNVSGNKQ